ncbi:MAG: sugar ABC transporter ATP-binding protein [Treponema sp.]|jgi:ribose transport system ATP-binding protein|nr:sugar ABC transporter ATP-binding protein [Treponema sp.]
MVAENRREILRVEHVSKSFPGVKALDDVSLVLHENEVLGLCGENGAGKSTLLKVFSGIYKADAGKIFFNGMETFFKTPMESIRAGINIIHQELSYLSHLTVAENVHQGRLPLRYGFINWKKLFKDTKILFEKYNIDINPALKLKDLSIAEKQIVEIMKVISRDAKIIVMDEPTSSLGMDDVKNLIKIIHALSGEGISIIFISHRLEEVIEVSDRLIVLRDGRNVADFMKDEFDDHKIISKMVGRNITQIYPKMEVPLGKSMLVFENVTNASIKNVSLEVRSGEIAGLYGMAGAGQDGIMAAAFGLGGKYSGAIYLDGKKLRLKTPVDAIKNGLGYVTAERKVDGLILNHAVRQNIALASLNKLSPRGIINYPMERFIAGRWVKELSIKTSSISTQINNLSGGNQQKVVLAKWLELSPKVLLLNEPTRGVDVGAKQEIFKFIQEMCTRGISVLMVSSDMMEMLGMADTVYTVWEGKITAKFPRKDVTEYKLMLAAINRREEII